MILKQQFCKKEHKRKKNVVQCACCRTMYDGSEGWVEFQPKTRKTPSYACPHCLIPNEKPMDIVRYSNYGKIVKYGIGVELVGLPLDKSAHALMICEDYQFLAENTTDDMIKYKSLYYPNLHGVKAVCRAFDENIISENTSTIRIIYKPTIDDQENTLEKRIDFILLDEIQSYLQTVPESTKKVIGCIPDNWITVKDNEATFEGGFIDAKTFFWYVNFCRDILQFATHEKNFKTLSITDVLDKYAEGKAYCQRPERNSW